jgi:hypothetical protein
MGIKDLLPSVADAMHKDFPLAALKGKRVAVDASGEDTEIYLLSIQVFLSHCAVLCCTVMYCSPYAISDLSPPHTPSHSLAAQGDICNRRGIDGYGLRGTPTLRRLPHHSDQEIPPVWRGARAGVRRKEECAEGRLAMRVVSVLRDLRLAYRRGGGISQTIYGPVPLVIQSMCH